MEQIHLLILLCVSMLLGSFFSGYAPLAFKMSDSKSRLLALLGSGILVGTALAIIIPEGIDSLYDQQSQTTVDTNYADLSNSTSTGRDASRASKTWTIGLSLVTGFVLMLFIDQFSIYQSRGSHSTPQNTDYIIVDQEEDMSPIQDEDILYARDESEMRDITSTSSETRHTKDMHKVSMRALSNGVDHSQPFDRESHLIRRPSNTKVTPTLGLVIHASADGIALGAAATTSHREVEMIIFLAIMLHKAPAAFSLVVFLIHRGLKHSTIRKHLLAFSLSAPLAALVTYFGLSQSGKEALRRNNATGIAMLFSAGTFLYVATVHVLPELVHNKLLSPKELLFLVGGAFLPLLLAQTI